MAVSNTQDNPQNWHTAHNKHSYLRTERNSRIVEDIIFSEHISTKIMNVVDQIPNSIFRS